MFYVKKSNRYFKSKPAAINHIRCIYTSMEDAYLSEYNITSPICTFCDNTCKFIGYFSGYSDICSDRLCVKRKYIIVNNKIAFDRKRKLKESNINDIQQFIIDNIEYYIRNNQNTNIIDLYTNKHVGNISLRSFLSRKFSTSIFIKTNVCKYCNETYDFDILIHGLNRQHCFKKKCVSLNTNKYSEVKTELSGSKELNNYYLNNKISITNLKELANDPKEINGIYSTMQAKSAFHWHCPITDWIIPIIPRTTFFYDYLNRERINHIKYFDEYLPNYIYRCKYCNSVYIIDYNFNKNINSKFCNQDCYFKYKKSHPDEYEYSSKSKLKQSLTMKVKIKNNEFTPNITNSWTHWTANIIAHNKIFKFRSSWEACFWLSQPHLKYEYLRIGYTDSLNKNRIYITDFIDEVNKIIYEIKPKSVWNSQRHKMNQIILYCQNNNFKFIWINEDNILNYIDQSLFTDEENNKQLNKLLNGIKKHTNKTNRKNN